MGGIDQALLAVVERIQGMGAAGIVAFVALYVAAALLLLPGSLLTLAAGFAYGPIGGTLLVSPASVLAAAAAFSLGRSLLRGRVERRVAKHATFAAIDGAIAKNGARVVLLLRLSPILPFNLLNYALGLTRVPLSRYVAASWIGMLPGTVLYVYLGSLITQASRLAAGRPSAGPFGAVLFWGGLAATVAATVLITAAARRELRRELGGSP